MKARFPSIDYARVIGMYLVVIGHLGISSFAHVFVYSFHMPLFFFLSGAVFETEGSRPTGRISVSFKKLMVPYSWFCLCSFLSLTLVAMFFDVDNLSLRHMGEQLLWSLIGMIYGTSSSLDPLWNNVLWFLPCLFLIHVVYRFAVKVNRILFLGLALSLQFVVPAIVNHVNPKMPFNRLMLSTDSAMIGLFFFHLGNIFSKKGYLSRLARLSDMVLFPSFLLFLVLLSVSSLSYRTCFSIGIANQGTYPVLSYLQSAVGIAMVIALSMTLERTLGRVRLAEFISRNTLTIFSTHLVVVWNLHRIELLLNRSFDFIKRSPYFYGLTILLICMLLAYVVENYAPFIVSKKRRTPLCASIDETLPTQ
jgi:acyltransferase